MFKKLKWFIKDFEWMKVYFSPFKPPKPKFYFGEVSVGVPYFLPRVWKKATPEKARKKALEELERVKKHNSVEGNYKLREDSFETLYERYLRHEFAEPKKIGFDFVGLRWKTKFNSFRHEHNPVWSFVFFGYQIALIFRLEDDIHYWECFLAWEYDTDKSKSPQERLKEAKEKHRCTWTSYSNEEKITTDYWTKVIRKKYLK